MDRVVVAIAMLALVGCDASPEARGYGNPDPAEQRGDVDGAAGVGGAPQSAAGGRAGTAGAGAGGALADAGAVSGAGGSLSGIGGASGASGWAAAPSEPLPCAALGWNPSTFNACSSVRADGKTEYRYSVDGRLCGSCLPARPAGAEGACLTSTGPTALCVATSCAECPLVVIGEDGANPLALCSAPANVVRCNSSALTSAGQTCSTCMSSTLTVANVVGCLLSPTAVCSQTCQECWNL